MQNKMSELYTLTKKFNTISGSINELSEKAFIEQYTYVREEFREMVDTFGDDDLGCARLSLETRMLEPLLDDCLDVVITVFGMLQKLEALGVDINQAAVDTAHNNLSKYPSSPAIAHETVERKRLEGIETRAVFNEAENCFAIRNVATGKIVKCIGYTPNNLRKYITQEVITKYKKENND